MLGYPPKTNSVLTRREMFLPSELGNDGPEKSKDQYHRTRNDGRESKKKKKKKPMLFSPSCISRKPFTKTIYKTQMSWAEKILW